MHTPICDDLGIEFPIFAFTHCRDVVVAVAKAGGFGVLGAVGFSPEQLEIELNWIDEHIGDRPYGVDIVIPNKYEGMDTNMSVMFRKLLDEGQAGDNVGVLLRGTKREEVERGQVLCKPGSINPHTKFEAEVYVLTKEEGGRHTPFFKGYRPQFYFRTTDVTGAVELPEGTEMVMPGDNIKIVVELIAPIAMEQGLRFAIREGGKTVGAGVVAKVIA